MEPEFRARRNSASDEFGIIPGRRQAVFAARPGEEVTDAETACLRYGGGAAVLERDRWRNIPTRAKCRRQLAHRRQMRQTGASGLPRLQRRIECQTGRQLERLPASLQSDPARAAVAAIPVEALERRRSISLAFAPPFRERRQNRHAARSQARCPFRSHSVEKGDLDVEADVEMGGYFEGGIVEHMRSLTAAPRHDVLVAQSQQLQDLRTKEPKHRAEPLVERLGRTDISDLKAVEHAADIAGRIPGFSGNPAIGCKEPNRLAL